MNYFQRFIYWLFFPKIYWVTAYDHSDDFQGAWCDGGWTTFFDGTFYTISEAIAVMKALQPDEPMTLKVQVAFPMNPNKYHL